MQTDAGGNVPGWVNEGSYKVVAAASGGFGGGSINFDALYGGGTSQIATGAVGPSQIQANSITTGQLDPSVTLALVPAGVILDYAGVTPPSGFLSCDGSVKSQSTYPNLYNAIGSTWNTGGEGAGNFRLPSAVNRFGIGAGGTLILGHSGGALGHTHSVGSISFGIPALTVNATSCSVNVPNLSVSGHSHGLSGNGFAQMAVINYFGNTAIAGNTAGSFGTNNVWYDAHAWGFTTSFGAGGAGWALGGSTDSAGATAFGAGASGSTGSSSTVASNVVSPSGSTGAADPPFIVVNKIIKT